ncbi:hypothetical protein [Arthrobacter sp. UYCu723]
MSMQQPANSVFGILSQADGMIIPYAIRQASLPQIGHLRVAAHFVDCSGVVSSEVMEAP